MINGCCSRKTMDAFQVFLGFLITFAIGDISKINQKLYILCRWNTLWYIFHFSFQVCQMSWLFFGTSILTSWESFSANFARLLQNCELIFDLALFKVTLYLIFKGPLTLRFWLSFPFRWNDIWPFAILCTYSQWAISTELSELSGMCILSAPTFQRICEFWKYLTLF